MYVFISKYNLLTQHPIISDDGRTTPHPREGRPPLPEPQEHMCLVKAKFRSKKLSTVIHQKDVNKFQVAFSNLLKGNKEQFLKALIMFLFVFR